MSASLVINAITEAFVQEVLASEAIKLLVGSINELTARNKELSERLEGLETNFAELAVRYHEDAEGEGLADLKNRVEKLEEGIDSRIEDYLDHNLDDKVDDVISKGTAVEDAVEEALGNASISISVR